MTAPRIEAVAVALYASVNKPHAEKFGWDEVKPRWQENYRSDARAALAAADKAATITTVEELDALPEETVIRDAREYVFELIPNPAGQPEWWSTVDTLAASPAPALPARVIHWGTE